MTDVFPFQGPRGLLLKAQRELKQLLEAVEPVEGEPNREQIGDLTMNIAWTLWHVTDWVANNHDPAAVRIVGSKGITRTDEGRAAAFQNQLKTESPDLRHCWELATRFKHFELDERSRDQAELEDFGASAPPMAEVLVSCFPYPSGETATVGLSAAEALVKVAGSLHPVAPEAPHKTLHPKIQHDGERLRLTEVYGRAYDYLDRLLNQQGL